MTVNFLLLAANIVIPDVAKRRSGIHVLRIKCLLDSGIRRNDKVIINQMEFL